MKIPYPLQRLYITLLSNHHKICKIERKGSDISIHTYWDHYIDIYNFKIYRNSVRDSITEIRVKSVIKARAEIIETDKSIREDNEDTRTTTTPVYRNAIR